MKQMGLALEQVDDNVLRLSDGQRRQLVDWMAQTMVSLHRSEQRGDQLQANQECPDE